MTWMLGLCGFGLFFLNDYNDWRLGWRALKGCFPLGAALLMAATALDLRLAEPAVTGWLRWGAAALAAVFFALLVYTLFFALPARDAYTRHGQRRRACTTGVYALCRHPGVLWFTGLYACLWLAGGLPLWEAAVYSGLNIGLVVFEDRCVFPAVLEGYGDYRAATPFLLPSLRGLRGRSRTQ